MARNRCAGMAVDKYQILFSGVALSLTSGLVPCRSTTCYHAFQTIQKRYLVPFFICYWCIQHMAACFVTDIYTDGNDYPWIEHCTTSEGDTQNIRQIRGVVGQVTTRSRATNDSKTMELPLLTSTNIYTDKDELSHQKEHCYIWIIGDTDQLEPDIT
ncbi:hypothetical protein BDB01DRAFT_790332 [Pilobolus umbonatus]|nr:hypothetical protein BDB01DRAFT_790332 [Pilobolus umbonatus]